MKLLLTINGINVDAEVPEGKTIDDVEELIDCATEAGFTRTHYRADSPLEKVLKDNGTPFTSVKMTCKMDTYIILTETAFKGSLCEMTPDDYLNFKNGEFDKAGYPIDGDYTAVDFDYALAIAEKAKSGHSLSSWEIAVVNLFGAHVTGDWVRRCTT
jgi:hypothetical protein